MPVQGKPRIRPTRWSDRVALAFALLISTTGVAGVAEAADVTCGSVIVADVTLKHDVGPCPSGGINVVAQGITVDLDGHRIFGTTDSGDGVGISVLSSTGVTVKNGTVSNFDGGVLISKGSQNKVTKIKAVANVGLADVTTFGDGFVISGSSFNQLLANEARQNGPFSGISVISGSGGSIGNKISKNIVQDNDVASNVDENNDVGIRLEASTRETTLKQNVISFSGLDGISIFRTSKHNVLTENTVKANGFHDKAHRKGDGIRIFGADGPDENVLTSNAITNNAANGIVLSVDATGNTVQKTKASRNGFASPGSFDLTDLNPGCDQNTWLRNKGTRSLACVQ
jgi:parallel beta-helix repeat protein